MSIGRLLIFLEIDWKTAVTSWLRNDYHCVVNEDTFCVRV